MKAGFSEFDITPRSGCQLFGFGPFINRVSVGVRDPLGARAAVLEDDDGRRCVIIGCDLGIITAECTAQVRKIICGKIPGVREQDIMVTCSHTHSGPAVCDADRGWGAPDIPYLEILPYKIAQSAIDASGKMEKVVCGAAKVPCCGIGVNRIYDIGDKTPLAEVLKEDWEPAHPELTDTEAIIVSCNDFQGNLKGFFVSFGCHPVVCCKETHYVHGDYPALAIHKLMKEFPGSVGIFLQGALGDVNTGCVHQPEKESMAALDVFASRFAEAVRTGLSETGKHPFSGEIISDSQLIKCQLRRDCNMDFLCEKEKEFSAVLHRADASDAGYNERISAVKLLGVRKMIRELQAGKPPVIEAEIQALRIGPVELLGAPFEIMQKIKNDTLATVNAPLAAVVSCSNGYCSYAPDQQQIDKKDGYAASTAPFIIAQWPLADIHNELVTAFRISDRKLFKKEN